MPTVLRIFGYRFHFYSDEGNEPAHIHVDPGDSECKFWVCLAGNRGVAPAEIRYIERLFFEHQYLLKEKHHEYHPPKR